MNKIYNITKIQLIIIWLFGVFGWLYTFDGYENSIKAFFFVFIPFILFFYTAGWFNYRK
jgi:hypothetical protein